MTPLPAPLGGDELIAWRLDRQAYARTWDSGEGAYQVGGRWNSAGVRAVYCAIDPSTAILEVGVHKGFPLLDTTPHVLTQAKVVDLASVRVVLPEDVPNPNWLYPGQPSAGQQGFGDRLLADHRFVVIPSVVSRRSWNLLFVAEKAAGAYVMKSQERFALDPRLHPPAAKQSL